MDTTHSEVILTMNSPESAPRDEMILGRFVNEGIQPAIWGLGAWLVPGVIYEIFRVSGRRPSFLKTKYLRADSLLGWLPMPRVNKAGEIAQ